MAGLPRAAYLVLRLLFAAGVTALLCTGGASAQTTGLARESAVKAAFLVKFVSFVEWPAAALTKPGQPVVIGVAGNEAVAADLAQIVLARRTDSGEVVLRVLNEGDGLAGLHVLYIGPMRPGRVREMTAAARGPVLVVTDQEDGLGLGGVLNFIVDGARVRFAASVPAAEARDLRLSARLLAVAQVVEGARR